jgi:hypothetical protein
VGRGVDDSAQDDEAGRFDDRAGSGRESGQIRLDRADRQIARSPDP